MISVHVKENMQIWLSWDEYPPLYNIEFPYLTLRGGGFTSLLTIFHLYNGGQFYW
jgi:hypothetical protein